jgi:hypothetical protein
VPTFDPANALASWAWESAGLGLIPQSGWHDIEFSGESLSNNALTLPRGNISRASQTPVPLAGKIETAGTLSVDAINPLASWFPFLALMQKVDVDEVETGAFRHRISRTRTDATAPAETIAIRAWRDDGMGQVFLMCRVQQIAITFAERALVSMEITIVPQRGEYWDDPVKTAGTGTGLPRLRGLVAAQFGTDATQNFYAEVTAQDANSVTIKTKLGDADAMGATARAIARASWVQVYDEANVRQGAPGDPLEIRFETGADHDVGDIYRFDYRRGEWVPSFADDIVVNECFSTVSLDGVDIELESGTLTIAKPAEQRHGFGLRRARRTRSRGKQTVQWQFQREYFEEKTRGLLELATAFAFRLNLDSGVAIGATAFNYAAHFVSLNCRASGQTASATDAETMDETLSFSGHPSTDADYPDDVTAEFYNDIASLPAA